MRLIVFESLRNRLLGLLLLVALPCFFAVFYHADHERTGVIEGSKTHAGSIISNAIIQQQKIIEDTRIFLIKLANYDQVQALSGTACSAYLAEVLRINSSYVNLGVPSADGELLCNALPMAAPINVSDRGYFKRVIRNRDFSIGEFQMDRAVSMVSLNFAYPVFSDNGQLTGAVVAVVSLDWWSSQLSKTNLPQNAVAVISDADGNVVANYPSQPEHLGQPAELNNVRFHNDEDRVVTGSDGVQRVFATSTLYTTSVGRSVSMSVGIPVGEAIDSANQEFYLTLTFITALMGVVLIIAIRGLKRSILEPLDQLTQATRSLSEGQSTEFSTKDGACELVQLQNQFMDMAQKRLAAEQKATVRNEELNSVFNALPDLFFRLDEDCLIIDFKAADKSDLYLQPDNFLNKSMCSLLPEDAAEEFIKHHRMMKEEKGFQCWEYSLDFPDGRKQFEARLHEVAGTAQSVMVVRNITEMKQAEESLLLSATVFNSINEAVMVTDAEGLIVGVNPAFTQVTGYTFEEVQGSTPSVLNSGCQSTEFYQDFWESLNITGRWEGEIYNRRKNGDIYPQWLTVNTIYDSAGQPCQRVAMFIDFTEKKSADELIWRQAHLDSLTGLPNRKLLNDRIKQELQHSDRSGLPTAILFLDLDMFKEVNDTLGHAFGDQLLSQAAQRISGSVRSVDTVARQGGDEFAIIIGQIKNSHVVDSICEQLLLRLAEPYQLGDETAYITSSIGIALYPVDASNAEDLIKSADQAMYVAKDNGRNRFQYFTREMQEDAVNRLQRVSDMRIALTEQQFVLHYQPLVSMSDRSICKAEALIRWQHPTQGMISPDDFIPIAEETHLITPIGNWVLEEASKTVLMLQQRYNPHFQVSINISPAQFESLDSNISVWLEQLNVMGLEGEAIVAEITERVMMASSKGTRDKMIAFKNAGVQVALDDFGTGYSSLAYISEYDIDYLKIDQYFVSNLSITSDAYTLCKAIIVMAHNLGIKVIAEGVETELQHRLLKELGCDYGQGYLYSRPVGLGDFEQLLHEQNKAQNITEN